MTAAPAQGVPPSPVEGYAFGPATVVHTRAGIVTVFVARWAAHPSTWLRFLRKIDDPSAWWVTAYKTKRDAIGDR